ncbi:hypothetical protein PTTG_11500, partial [Puccinia triticina 1-1 BBBD Race 1]
MHPYRPATTCQPIPWLLSTEPLHHTGNTASLSHVSDVPDPLPLASSLLNSLGPHSAPVTKQKQQQRTPLLSACTTLPSSLPIINPTMLRKPVGIILPPFP